MSIWGLIVLSTYRGARNEIRQLFDTQLQQSARVAARTLLGLPDKLIRDTKTGDQSDVDPTDDPQARYEKNLVVQVWDADGQLFLHSESAPLTPLSGNDDGFSDQMIKGDAWRTYSFKDAAHGLTVKVGEPYDARNYLTEHVVLQTLYPIVLGLPVLAVLIWFAVGRGLRPLRRVAREVSRRDPENLDTIDVNNIPAEVQPLIAELNGLLQRLSHAIDRERQFTADAAHELRTPLAGLKVQAQVALGAGARSGKDKAIEKVLSGVDRASHLVDQLLTLSRLDQATPTGKAAASVAAIADTVANDVRYFARQRDIDVNTITCDSGAVCGYSDAIYIMLRNLVDNAVRYAPAGSVVSLDVSQRADTVNVAIKDQGTGIPLTSRQRVFERFYRGTNQQDGSGLGLSIVQRIAELHDARVEFVDASDGFVVNVIFSASRRSTVHEVASTDHRVRERIWPRGFGDVAVKGHTPPVNN